MVDKETPGIADSACSNYDKVRSIPRRNEESVLMKYCRKIYATYPRDRDIPTEIIDLLQGRISSSIFAMHYYRPSFKQYRNKIEDSLGSLNSETTQ